MKNLYLIYFTLLSFCVLAQKKEAHAIQIHLEDAETGATIRDAKVTLEGFEIPALTAKYDQQKKVYYFTEIQKGYNTIMAYHKKYNEKGFQNIDGLPKELKLRLYDPLNVSYSFEKPVLTSENCCNEGKKHLYQKKPEFLKRVENSKRKISRKTFRYIYTEDPYHIAIISKLGRDQFFNNDTIKKLIDNLSIEETTDGNSERYYLAITKEGNLTWFPRTIRSYVYLFQKKDSTKFQRFNSPEIKKLRQNNLIVSAINTRKLEYYSNKPYNAEKYIPGKLSDFEKSLQQYPYCPICDWNSKIEISYFDTQKEDNYYYNFKRTNYYPSLPSTDDDKIFSFFFVISKDQNSGMGLGVLDNMETGKKNDEYIFTNSYGK
ncbi:MAG: hypothetical protein V4572_01530 [Bacteroidota bacterium]